MASGQPFYPFLMASHLPLSSSTPNSFLGTGSEIALTQPKPGLWFIRLPGMATNGLSFASTCFQRFLFQLEMGGFWRPPKTWGLQSHEKVDRWRRWFSKAQNGLHFASHLAKCWLALPSGRVQLAEGMRCWKVPQIGSRRFYGRHTH